MKKISIAILLLFCSVLLAKDEIVLPKDETGKVIYTEVVQVEGIAKDELYSRALEWFAKTFNSAKNVIQLQDKEEGRIVGKALFQIFIKDVFSKMDAGVIHYTISVATKDGRYKYEIVDFSHDATTTKAHIGSGGDLASETPASGSGFLGAGGLTKGQWRQIKEQTDVQTKLLIESLKAAMLKKVEEW